MQAAQNGNAVHLDRSEESQLSADDLRNEAIGLEPIFRGFRETGKLDPVHAHNAGSVQFHPLRQPHHGLAVESEGMDLRRRELQRVVDECGRDPGGRNPATDDALAVVGLQAVDAEFVLPGRAVSRSAFRPMPVASHPEAANGARVVVQRLDRTEYIRLKYCPCLKSPER